MMGGHSTHNIALIRAPQSASIAKSILEQINTVLSGEPEYRAATDAEFADLIWTGLSKGGPEVTLALQLLSHCT